MIGIGKFTSLLGLSFWLFLANISVAADGFVKTIDKRDISPISGIMDPYNIRFTQGGISAEFSDGSSVFEVIKKMRDGKIDPGEIPAIRIFVKNGVFYSVDNRRLFLFQQVGAPIKYELITTPKEVMKHSFKFDTVNDGRGIIVRPPKSKSPEKVSTSEAKKALRSPVPVADESGN